MNSSILPFYCGSKLSCYIVLALVSDLTWCRVLSLALPNGESKCLPPASLDLQYSAHWCGVWCVKKKEMGQILEVHIATWGLFSPCSQDVTHHIKFLKTDATVTTLKYYHCHD